MEIINKFDIGARGASTPSPRWDYLTAYSDYLSDKKYSKFPEGTQDRFRPINPVCCRYDRPMASPIEHTISSQYRQRSDQGHKYPKKSSKFRRSPTNVPKLPIYDLNSADRITSQLQAILSDLQKVSNKAHVKRRRKSKSPNKMVRFEGLQKVNKYQSASKFDSRKVCYLLVFEVFLRLRH